ncbi:MAG TPA: hypothetical protein VK524_31965 [Polyangiaceae bacterium]|nr:hypothetical protein [Polyangiaceae bacterium]
MHKLALTQCLTAALLAACGGKVSEDNQRALAPSQNGATPSRGGEETNEPRDGDERPGATPDSTCTNGPDATGGPDADPPRGSKPANADWENQCFTTWDPPTCNGARYVRYDQNHDKYVGVILCSSSHYKIYLGESLTDAFYQIGDYAGHGQDHCELLDPDFRIPNEDAMKSGGCSECATSADRDWYENPVGTRGYSRATFAEQFRFEPVWPQFNLYTVEWYACGVTFSAEGAACADPGGSR